MANNIWWPANQMYVELSDGQDGLNRYAATDDLTRLVSVGNTTPAEGDQKTIEWYCDVGASRVEWRRLREYHDGRAELFDSDGSFSHYADMQTARTKQPQDHFNFTRGDVEGFIESDRIATQKLVNAEPFPEPGALDKQFIAYFRKKNSEIPDEDYEQARAIRHRIDQRCWDSHRELAERLRSLKLSPPAAADRKELARLLVQHVDPSTYK